MTPLRAPMTRDMALQRLAPTSQQASIAAVAGLAQCYGCAPDHLRPAQSRASLPPCLVERHLAWRSCPQGACGRKFFSVTPLGWDARPRNVPPRTGRRLLPHLMRVEKLQRLCTSAPHPQARAWLMTTSAAGRRVGEGVRLPLPDLASARLLIRVHQGNGRQERDTRLSARLLAALRASGTLSRPASWLCPGHDAPQPMPRATAQKLYDHAQRAAGITPGKGLHTRRHCFATQRLDAGVDLRTIPRLLGHRSIDTTTRSLHLSRQHLAQGHSPFALLSFGDTPCPQPA